MAGLPTLQSSVLAKVPSVRHAFFTRQGGVSTGIYASLNLGLGSKDDAGHVLQNRRRVAAHMKVTPDALMGVYQVHSAHCIVAHAAGQPRLEADALVTEKPGLALTILTADCAPVLFADAEAKVIGACHAGWKGALGGVVEATVAAMRKLGADPKRITAAIGPCIAQASYEVGADFMEPFLAEHPGSAVCFAPGVSPDKRQFDLPAYVLSRLQRAGVGHAQWIGEDTCADAARFYSNRRAFKAGEPDFGRLVSTIVLDN